MKAHHLSLMCLAGSLLCTGADAAIYEYVFTGTLKGEVSESGAPETVIEAPIRGVLALDTTSTTPVTQLDSDSLTLSTAELYMVVGDGVHIAASGSVGAIGATSFNRPMPARFSHAGDFPTVQTGDATGFPASLTLARADAPGGSLQFQLSGLNLAFDGDTLFSLKVGDLAAGEIMLGSLLFSEDSGDSVALDFTVTQIQRRKHHRYSPEWASLRAHLAEVNSWNEEDDFLLQFLPTPNDGPINGGGDPLDPIGGGEDGGLDPIGVIPEPSMVTLLLGAASLMGALRRRRR